MQKKDASKMYHIQVFNDCAGNEFQYADSLLINELVLYCEAYNYYFEMYRFEEMIVKVAQNAQDKLDDKIVKQNDKLFKQSAKEFSLAQIKQYIPQLLVQLSINAAAAVMLEATLSFIGLGIQPPNARSWHDVAPAWSAAAPLARASAGAGDDKTPPRARRDRP